MDPNRQFYSPYLGMGNNPVNGFDPDGRDVIVLNAPEGASGFGHNALLIGNDKDGWTFISKEGRAGGAMLTGGPALEPDIASFNTLEEFHSHPNYRNYKRGVLFETTSEEDQIAIKEARQGASSRYHVLFSNCGQLCGDILDGYGIDPGYTNRYGQGLGVIPNDMFINILLNNNDAIYMDFEYLRNEKKPIIEVGDVQDIEFLPNEDN